MRLDISQNIVNGFIPLCCKISDEPTCDARVAGFVNANRRSLPGGNAQINQFTGGG